MNYNEESLRLHKEKKGKISVVSKVPLKTRDDMSTAYSPGVAAPCLEIAKDPALAYTYTAKQNLVAVVTDGSAVLGLGNIGGLAGMPVMEGKAVLFKEFGDVDAIPLCLATQNVEEVIATVRAVAPTFGGINLEDIKAPECFAILEALQDLDIPVFHDDQDGTAIVVLAGLINALKIVNKELATSRIAISGAGAAGIAITRLLLAAGAKDIVLIDSRGIVPKDYSGENKWKVDIAHQINPRSLTSTLADALVDADIFIGVSKPNVVTKEMVQSMAKDAIVFALANPDPEILPDVAYAGGAAIVGTGRSDYPNQINNVHVFPGLFRGLLDSRAKDVTQEMKIAAANAVAACVPYPSKEKIIPAIGRDVAKAVAKAVIDCSKK